MSTPIKKPDAERLADILEAYAMANNTPNHQHTGGDYFAGWPMDLLAETVSGQADWRKIPGLAHAVQLIKTRHGGPYGNLLPPTPPPQVPPPLPSLEEMLSMRMRWERWGGFAKGFAHIALHHVGDIVHVWVISKDAQSTVLTDDFGLFPSDALVTKLNMMKQE